MRIEPSAENLFTSYEVAATPKDTIFTDGTASLYKFRRTPGEEEKEGELRVPFLLVPSMINKWYVLDLRPGASMAEAMVGAGIDTYLLDWGTPNDEDQYLTWELVLARLGRMARRVMRDAGTDQLAMLGYCMGGTLANIYSALHPEQIAALVSLTAPVDFSNGGLLRTLVDEEWFDPAGMTAAGNLSAPQMESGFTSLRPTGKISKWILLADRWRQEGFKEGFWAMERWAGDNIPFPGAAYRTYIGELYQKNALYEGTHYVGGKHVDLAKITCPLLTVTASRDTICPPDAAEALNAKVSSTDQQVLTIPGGHVGAVVGSKAPKKLYPAVAEWLKDKVGREPTPEPKKPATRSRARSSRAKKAE